VSCNKADLQDDNKISSANGESCSLEIPAKWDQKLGEGTFGAIYPSTRQDGYVVKVAYALNECKNFKNENALSGFAHEALAKNPLMISNNFTIIVPKIIDFKINDLNQCCYYEMQRIYPPFPETCAGIVQLLFGNDVLDYENCEKAGYSLGPNPIAKKLANKYPNINVNDLAQGIGALYALLQFAGKQDGHDVEFVFGLDHARQPVLAALDYDKSGPIENVRDEHVPQLTRALNNGYFPRPKYKDLFAAAEKGYLDTASRLGRLEIARAVIARYQKFFLSDD